MESYELKIEISLSASSQLISENLLQLKANEAKRTNYERWRKIAKLIEEKVSDLSERKLKLRWEQKTWELNEERLGFKFFCIFQIQFLENS